MAAFTLAERIAKFGDPTGGKPPVEKGRGLIIPDRQWVADNIVWVDFPFYLPLSNGKKARGCQIHRKCKPSLLKALRELEQNHLQGLIHSFDGSFVPRHIGWKAGRPLSTHAWGIAVDLNTAEFPMGSLKVQARALVETMANHGFACGQNGGGLWANTMDPMHFEYTFRG